MKSAHFTSYQGSWAVYFDKHCMSVPNRWLSQTLLLYTNSHIAKCLTQTLLLYTNLHRVKCLSQTNVVPQGRAWGTVCAQNAIVLICGNYEGAVALLPYFPQLPLYYRITYLALCLLPYPKHNSQTNIVPKAQGSISVYHYPVSFFSQKDKKRQNKTRLKVQCSLPNCGFKSM